MKLNKRFMLHVAVVLLVGLAMVGNAHATKAQAEREALAIMIVASALGYKIQGGIGSHYLKLDEIDGVRYLLHKGRDYKLVVGGCNDAYDLDLVVIDENGYVVGKDVTYDKRAEVDVSPRRTGEFYITIKMTAGTPDGAHFALINAYK